MRYREVIEPRVRSVLLRQVGMITVHQATGLGLGPEVVRRLVEQGHWRRAAEGLYDANPLHTSFDKLAWTAVLHAGEYGAIGGEAALRLHGLGFDPARIEVWVPPTHQLVHPVGVAVRRDFLDRTGRAGGVPTRISPVDAILDVGQWLSTQRLIALLSNSLRLRLVTTTTLLEGLEARRRVRQRQRFVDLLADLDGVDSVLEYEYRRDVERAHGLPVGTRQISVSGGSRSDVLYEEYGVLVEIDGRLGHQDADSAFRDLRRDNRHVVGGRVTLRYRSADIRALACDVGRQVGTVLRSRGWPGWPQACPRCWRQAVS